MKRSLFAILPVLALLAGCASLPEPPKAPTPPAAPSAPSAPAVPAIPAPFDTPTPIATASVAQKELRIQLTDCDSVRIVEAEDQELSFDGSNDGYACSISDHINGSAVVTARKTGSPDGLLILSVPSGVYSSVQINAQNSGVSLTAQLSDYSITGTNNAVGVSVPENYTGKLTMDQKNSACSVKLSKKLANLTFQMEDKNCATSCPTEWKNARSFTRGSGGAAIDLKFTGCSVSISETAAGFTSKYQEGTYSVMMSGASSREMLISKSGFWNGGNEMKNWRETWKAASKPDTVKEIKTIPAEGIQDLQVNVNLCGLLLEPSKSGSFELSYLGVENTGDIAVLTEVKDGMLTVTAEGGQSEYRYINVSADCRVNVVRLGVPENLLGNLSIDCGTAITATNGLTLPAVAGETTNGMILLQADAILAPVSLNSKNGSLAVDAKTISSPVTLDTINGSADMKAGSVTADVTLNTKNGGVSAIVDSSTGKMLLSTKNGDVSALLGQVADATISATNGHLQTELGLITGDVSCSVSNGTMNVSLTKKPTDLTFRCTGGWQKNEDDEWSGKWMKSLGLPEGWHNGLVLGNGKPSLTLSASSNGYVYFAAP